jgi:hypothetical protein
MTLCRNVFRLDVCAAYQSAFTPCTVQLVGMLPRPAVEPISTLFMNQIAVLPLVRL